MIIYIWCYTILCILSIILEFALGYKYFNFECAQELLDRKKRIKLRRIIFELNFNANPLSISYYLIICMELVLSC